MNLIDAQNLALRLMREHGVDWVPFEFSGTKVSLGHVSFLKQSDQPVALKLSRHYTAILPEDEIREVILHEIAHVLAGPNAGHGHVWKLHARRLGIKGDRCATPSAKPKAPIQLKCAKGHSFDAHRLPQRVKSCSTCHPRKFSFAHVLEVYKNGRRVPLGSMPFKYQNEYNRQALKNTLNFDGRSLFG